MNLAGEDGLLILDDLYHIRRSDQPLIVDYFHRLTKNQRMWLKVGTIRHRSTWFVRSDPAVGTKLGDDADAINLDITLERYNIAKAFLTKSSARYPSPRGSSRTSCSQIVRLTGLSSRVVGSRETVWQRKNREPSRGGNGALAVADRLDDVHATHRPLGRTVHPQTSANETVR